MLGRQALAVDASLADKERGRDELEDQLDEDQDILGLGMDLVEQGAVACGSSCWLSRLKSSLTVVTSCLTSSPARHTRRLSVSRERGAVSRVDAPEKNRRKFS